MPRRKGTITMSQSKDTTTPDVVEDDLDAMFSDIGIVASENTTPADLAVNDVDTETAVALAKAEADFVPLEPTKLEGDGDDPLDERSFKTCTNEQCPFKAGCLRWRLRNQRAEYNTASFFFADQDNCLVEVHKYPDKFALDTLEDW